MAQKKQRRESKSTVIYVPIAVLLVLFLMVLGTSVFLGIIEIEVIGASKYSSESIIEASGLAIGDNMLFLDTETAEQSICSAMPYIKDASIELSLPDKVRIYVSEAKAIAAIDFRDGVIIIDSAGRVLERVEEVPYSLIEVRGFTPTDTVIGSALRASPGDDTRLRYLTETLSAIEREDIQSDVSYVDVTSIVYVSFQYQSRFTVVLGTTDNIRYKLSRLADTVEDIIRIAPGNETGRIDMSDREPWRWVPDR